MGTLDGHPCLITNAPYFQSELGHMLCTDDVTVAVMWFQDTDGKYVYSLRSADDGPDVKTIAVVHGGGGHVHAAGFSDDDPPSEVIEFA
jgi:nanoRNase/pAp phosphatase (c-di-AMP/oligoRNAs hydrolase)